MIQSAEREYSSAELPLEPTKAELMLREHEASRSKVKSLLDCTADEGEEIVIRVRQQVDFWVVYLLSDALFLLFIVLDSHFHARFFK